MKTILNTLHRYNIRPKLYTPGSANIWTDPYLSRGMLEAHLNDDTDAASFRAPKRRELLDFLDVRCPVNAYPSVLDVGCGPGLYAQEMAIRGRKVTGIDFSERSIAYAREAASQMHLPIRYVEGDYLATEFGDDQGQGYDLATMISCDFGVLSPDQRTHLLSKISRCLRPGGAFFLDVFTPDRPQEPEVRTWEHGRGGYWSDGDYLLLNQLWRYDGAIRCMQHILMEEQGIRTFHVWEHLFTPDELMRDLETAGLRATTLYVDHVGTPFQKGATKIFALAVKR